MVRLGGIPPGYGNLSSGLALTENSLQADEDLCQFPVNYLAIALAQRLFTVFDHPKTLCYIENAR